MAFLCCAQIPANYFWTMLETFNSRRYDRKHIEEHLQVCQSKLLFRKKKQVCLVIISFLNCVSQSAKKTRWHEIIVKLFLVFRNFFIQRGLSRYFQETWHILLAWEFRGTLGAGAIIWLDTYIERLTSSLTKICENRDWGFDIEYCHFFSLELVRVGVHLRALLSSSVQMYICGHFSFYSFLACWPFWSRDKNGFETRTIDSKPRYERGHRCVYHRKRMGSGRILMQNSLINVNIQEISSTYSYFDNK